MAAFLVALIACLLASTGGRDQLSVAGLAARLGRSGVLLAAAWLATGATVTLAASVGADFVSLFGPGVDRWFAIAALLVGAGQLAWPVKARKPEEPTRSFFAITTVIAMRQALDAPRLIIFALAANSVAPALVGLGGAIGSGLVLSLGWWLGDRLPEQVPLQRIRLVIAALLLAAAIWTGVSPRGIV